MNVDQRSPTRMIKSQKKNDKGKRKSSDDSLKVVYISSPMKVKTSPSRFRSLVQQLTGKNSDITRYMDDNNNDTGATEFDEIDYRDDRASLAKETGDQYQNVLSNSPDDTPSSSDYTSRPTDNVSMSQMKEKFEGIFSSDSYYDPSQMDVFGSFEEMLQNYFVL